MLKYLKWKFLKEKQTGLIPQPIDIRDYKYQKAGTTLLSVDLRPKFGIATNQQYYQSCTAHAVGALFDYTLKYKKVIRAWKNFNFSEPFIWYYSRAELGLEKQNTGAILRDCFKVVLDHGFVPEEFWTYADGIYTEPNERAKIAAGFFKLYLKTVPEYHAINTGAEIRNALSRKCPVVFGIATDAKFQQLNKDNFVCNEITGNSGYHAMLIVGYNEQGYIVRNSWGTDWGQEGYCIIKKEVLEERSFDKWTLM